MTIVMVIHFVHTVTLYISTPAVNRRMVTWWHGYIHTQNKGTEHQRKSWSDTIGNGKKKANRCWEFGLVNSMIQTIWKISTKIISAFEHKRSSIKQFLMPEWSDIDEALLKWFKQEISHIVPVSVPIPMIALLLPQF
jgi:hypothetical protein